MIASVRILVVTVVHHPEDSRIRHRQIKALLEAGWQVTYAAPFTGYGLSASGAPEGLSLVDLPRAAGRRRFRSWRAARDLLKRRGPQHDVILLHDPELLAALPGRGMPPVVWDVHEDTVAALTLKPWLPRLLRPIARRLVERMERWAERRVHLILAEYAYRNRFRDEHLVVPNVNVVPQIAPPPDQPRAVYVGSLTPARGALDMIEVARLVAGKTQGAVKLLLIGPASGDLAAMLQAAADEGVLDWPGFLPSDEAMRQLDGSVAGLSLLHDEPNYRVSLPTKVVEYMAHGIPVVTTPLPLAQELVAESGCGVVVPFGDSEAVARAILDLWSDPERRRQMGTAGHLAARERYDWATHGADFVAELHRLIQRSRR
jgi:glycosyltransferase involved in cell wall biosynthesis